MAAHCAVNQQTGRKDYHGCDSESGHQKAFGLPLAIRWRIFRFLFLAGDAGSDTVTIRVRCGERDEAVLGDLDTAEKAVTDCGYRGDVTGLMDIVPKLAAKKRDAPRKGVLSHLAVIPDRVEE